jgi:hypothetical protein
MIALLSVRAVVINLFPYQAIKLKNPETSLDPPELRTFELY